MRYTRRETVDYRTMYIERLCRDNKTGYVYVLSIDENWTDAEYKLHLAEIGAMPIYDRNNNII